MKKLNKLIFNKRKYKKEFKPLITQFKCVRKENETDEELLERIKDALIYLKKNELKLLYKKYNEDLKNTTNDGTITYKDSKYISSKIIPKLIYHMRKERKVLYCRPLMDRFDSLTTFNEVLQEIKLLDNSAQKLLQKKFQKDYLGVTELRILTGKESYKIDLTLKNIETKIIRKRKEKTGLQVNILRNIRKILNTKECKMLSNLYGEKYAASIILKKYLENSSYEQISLLTQMNLNLIRILDNVDQNLIKEEQEEIKIRSLIK